MKTNNESKKTEPSNTKATSVKVDKSRNKSINNVSLVPDEFLTTEGNGNKGHVVGQGSNGIT